MNKSRTIGCEGYQRLTRRGALQSMAAGSAGLWLTQFSESLARAGESSGKPKSLLMIWLQGGPSQLETFDPHPGTLIGGDVSSIATTVAGLNLADTMPATAEQMHLATLVRSVVSKEGDHERASYHLKTGWRPDPTLVHPSIGSVVCSMTKGNLEIPRHVSILPGEYPGRGGYLGPELDAFQIGDPADPIPNLSSRVESERMSLRRGKLLDAVEDEFARGRLKDLDQARTLHRHTTKNAATMMDSSQLVAFDVMQEGAETRAKFGDSPFGRGCLAAIRLLDSGVRCVEVELGGWDTHINNHELQSAKAQTLDRALAATLQELEARDMLEDTVVFCGGEFGRTPLINPAGGRDHWPHGFSALMAGGKLRRGHVHGETAAKPDKKLLERDNSQPFDPATVTSDTVSVPNLHATLLQALGVDHTHENMTPIGRPLRWSDGDVIKSLLS